MKKHDANYERAETILKDNIDKLHLMAEALIKYETIDAKQIAVIMKGDAPPPPEGWTDDDAPLGGGDGGTPVEPDDVSSKGKKPKGKKKKDDKPDAVVDPDKYFKRLYFKDAFERPFLCFKRHPLPFKWF